jgi:hypothetical protein
MGLVIGLGGGAGGLMVRQNRVWPTGEIGADPARGLFMGNRGCLHDAEGRLGAARWRHCNWITCALSFKGRKRSLMSPGKYTELFFLDEAVACAAGHRPCAECRRPVWLAFQAVWSGVFGPMKAAEIDRSLHAARLEDRRQRRHSALARDLPDGTMVLIDQAAHLVLAAHALPWQADGYSAACPLPEGQVTVLTPAPMVAVMRAGWTPVLHDSARAQTAPIPG